MLTEQWCNRNCCRCAGGRLYERVNGETVAVVVVVVDTRRRAQLAVV